MLLKFPAIAENQNVPVGVEPILLAGPNAGPISQLASALERVLGSRSAIQTVTCPQQGFSRLNGGAWRAALVHLDWMVDWSAQGSLRGHVPLSRSRGNGKHARVALAYGDDPLGLPLPTYCDLLALGVTDVLDSASASFIDSALEAIAGVHVFSGQESTLPAGADLDSLFEDLGIVGQGPLMHEIYRQVHAAALYSEVPVLITGETGTGKQVLAEAIHRLDPKRSSKAIVTVNCSAITDTLAESELFGHRKGSFTGAMESRRGYFRAAHGGTLFLDEIGELSLRLQPKLLRALEQKTVVPVGEDREEIVDFRVIAATNRNLSQMVANNEFRMDLYQRLNVVAINVPPVRERSEDIVPLIKFFARKYGHSIDAVDDRVVDVLLASGLPGNVRELENLVRRIPFSTRFTRGRLRACDLPAEMLNRLGRKEATADSRWESLAHGLFEQLQNSSMTLEQLLNMCELSIVREALGKSAGNRQAAARMLQTTERTVFNKIRKHRLSALRPRPKTAAGSPNDPQTLVDAARA